MIRRKFSVIMLRIHRALGMHHLMRIARIYRLSKVLLNNLVTKRREAL